jgi:hypothetical protein
MLLPYALLANLAIAGCGADQMRDGSASDGVLARPMLTLEECADLRGEPLGIPGAAPRLGDPGIDLSRHDECPAVLECFRTWGGALAEGTSPWRHACCNQSRIRVPSVRSIGMGPVVPDEVKCAPTGDEPT